MTRKLFLAHPEELPTLPDAIANVYVDFSCHYCHADNQFIVSRQSQLQCLPSRWAGLLGQRQSRGIFAAKGANGGFSCDISHRAAMAACAH
jgi:hypothetical protein